MATGYNIELSYLSESIRKKIYLDEEQTILNVIKFLISAKCKSKIAITHTFFFNLKLYKNVYNPHIGHSLAFIGFIQPTSGGILAVSEIQSRWAIYNIIGMLKLPDHEKMMKEIKSDQVCLEK